jgi:hypothetical protein
MRASIELCHGDAALDLVGDATLAVIGAKMQFAAPLKRYIPGAFIASVVILTLVSHGRLY